MNIQRTLIIIAICALITFAARALPFLIFGKRPIPGVIRYLGRVLPMAIMTTLVIYCIKDISFTTSGGCLPYLAGIAVTAAVHWWKRNALLSIAAGTALYMVMVQFIFA